MGQVSTPREPQALILTSRDRLVAANADGGIGPTVEHIILLGENAGRNDAASNVIGLGFNALGASGLGLADTGLDGSIAIGQNALANINTRGTGAFALASPIIAIGRNAGALLDWGNSSVLIGDGVLADYLSGGSNFGVITKNVAIGRNAAAGVGFANNSRGFNNNVLIGDSAGSIPLVTNYGIRFSVLIGQNAGANFAVLGGVDMVNAVMIGAGAGSNAGTSDPANWACVFIGTNAGANSISTRSVSIGAQSNVFAGAAHVDDATAIGYGASIAGASSTHVGASCTGGNATSTGNTAVGFSINVANGQSSSVLLGAFAQGVAGTRQIMLGYGAGLGATADNDFLVVESNDVGTRRGLMFGKLGAGNLVIGHTVPGAQRTFRGTTEPTNAVKIMDGVAGTGTGPTAGGYFQSIAGGNLTWTDSSGATYQLTPNASLGDFLVAALPGTAATGARAFATDALAPVFAAAVVGGGAVYTPVYFDGAAWLCG